jgi:hypothetical protein
MFELGARPYPPREVYQQYLAQSDVFIGLYWQRYGQFGVGGRSDRTQGPRGLHVEPGTVSDPLNYAGPLARGLRARDVGSAMAQQPQPIGPDELVDCSVSRLSRAPVGQTVLSAGTRGA